jgi:two-component system chemotaxis response regulator CheB
MKKVLVVDDSALMRRQLSAMLTDAGGFQIRTARTGAEAVAENLSFEPDVITLDINMPEMDGLTALSLIMAQRPVPVIMVSSLTEQGALATFEALNLGALDYLTKPGGTISLSIDQVKAELLHKVNTALRAKLPSRPPVGSRGLVQRLKAEREQALSRPARWPSGSSASGLLLIGVSTGGPRTLEEILPSLPEDFPLPVLVAQHMPAAFTRSFAERLNGLCRLQVREAATPMPVEPGNIYIGKGGADMVLVERAGRLTVIAKPENSQYLWHPSVELLGRSALDHCAADKLIAVLLTGMGYDGADAFADIKRQGGRTIAESEDSAVVFGMPAELIARSGASMVLPVDKIAAQINLWAKR